ncbi:hypothetical protein VTN49DRAFT_3580 [Thermomyces lanuginosus]|uniref:uncharacterized protein n=1 Tax=Thermomyces lanuginosus TaxID=5541 RepID=UPI0037420C24
MNVASLVSPVSSSSSDTRRTRTYDQFNEERTSYFCPPPPAPRQPLSPPAEDSRKCSLPSISSLLECADGMPPAKRQRASHSPTREHPRPFTLPPTPPMRPGSGLHEQPSGTRSHSSSISSVPGMVQAPSPTTTLPPLLAPLPTPPAERGSISFDSRLGSAPYSSPAPSLSSYSSSTVETQTAAPPPPPPPSQPQPYSTASSNSAPAISPANPTWQHHHYFPQSTSTTYSQNNDRYVCRTCNKAFSRPSSLRIHSHSHTGEKPFRCTHAGCGKAFSVRSNMKRHERGCHNRPMTATIV